MLSAILILLSVGQCGPMGCRPFQGLRLFRPAPMVQPMPEPLILPAPDDDAIERARAEGRAEARAEAREARRCAGPSCQSCACGCRETGECRCGGASVQADLPTGVDALKLSPRPRITRRGVVITREEAEREIGQLADDSAKARLTLIGPESERKTLRKDLESEEWLRPLVLMQDYPPDSPFVSKHKADGLTLYLQRPDGTVLLREAGGPTITRVRDALKRALGLLPPIQPPPDPKAPQPGPDGKPAPAPSAAPIKPVTWAALFAALFALAAIPKRQETT